MNSSFAFQDPDAAIDALADALVVVSQTETHVPSLSVPWPTGRVLAEAVVADRDSPAADVSAMDGYACRLADLKPAKQLAISGESKAGSSPPSMVDGQVVRIFTGAIVPEGCEAIVKREDTVESANAIEFTQTAIKTIELGSHIRRRGENAAAGVEVLPARISVTPATVAALANFGMVSPHVFRRVRVAILTTGNEVVDPQETVLQPWQLRNSNRSAVESILSQLPFVSVQSIQHVDDDPDSLKEQLRQSIDHCDAVVMTGGVSKGDYDYVPECIAAAGASVVFHGLPIRPGKPILGASTAAGKLVLGLPGNPVSATINASRFLLPLLRNLSGQTDWKTSATIASLDQPLKRSISLHTMPLVRLGDGGTVSLVPGKGSGDLVAMAMSDGYLCVPPDETSVGPWPLHLW